MQTLRLSRGLVTLVDDDDFERFSNHKWSACWDKTVKGFYVSRQVRLQGRPNRKTKGVSLHREIMAAPAGMYVDHINHDTLDNRKENLRLVTPFESAINRRVGNVSGFRGVKPYRKRWCARMRIDGKRVTLAICDTPEEAAEIYSHKLQELVSQKLA